MPRYKVARGGWTNPASAANAENAGRKPTQATIKTGDGIFLTHILPDGVADLGRGTAIIEGRGRSRVIRLIQDDGSEIRIIVVKD